jgi:hypothetical protein
MNSPYISTPDIKLKYKGVKRLNSGIKAHKTYKFSVRAEGIQWHSCPTNPKLETGHFQLEFSSLFISLYFVPDQQILLCLGLHFCISLGHSVR